MKPILQPSVLLLAGSFGGLLMRRWAERSRAEARATVISAADLGVPLGQQATYVQFSSPAWSPVHAQCREVHRTLAALAAGQPGLSHVNVDATADRELAGRFGILRTPTVLVLDHDGLVQRRLPGALTQDQALAALPEPDDHEASGPFGRSRTARLEYAA